MMRGAVELMEIHLLLMNYIFRDDQRPQCPNDSISVMIFLYIISRQTKSFSVLNTDNICVVGPYFRTKTFRTLGLSPEVCCRTGSEGVCRGFAPAGLFLSGSIFCHRMAI